MQASIVETTVHGQTGALQFIAKESGCRKAVRRPPACSDR